MKERIFGLPRNVFLLGLTSLFNDLSSEMVFSVFPAFFTAVLKSGAGALGLVDGVAEATSNLFKIYSGVLSDRLRNRKRLIVSGYALSLATRPIYAIAASVPPVLGLRAFDRVGKGLRDAPRDALISLSTQEHEVGKAFGFHRAMDTIGGIIGPLVAYSLLLFFPDRFDLVFLAAFALGIPAVLTLLYVSDVKSATKENRVSLLKSARELTPRFKLFLASVALLSTGTLPVTVLLLKVSSIGLMLGSVPLFYVFYNISYAAFSMSAGKLSDRIGTTIVIFSGYLVLLAGYLFIGSARSTVILGFGFFVLGLFPALTDGVLRAAASKLTAESSRGAGLGFVNAMTGGGALLAGGVGGYLWQNVSPAAALITAAVVIVAGLLLFLRASRE